MKHFPEDWQSLSHWGMFPIKPERVEMPSLVDRHLAAQRWRSVGETAAEPGVES